MAERRKSTIGKGLKSVVGVEEEIDRSMITGWEVDEVASLLAKGKATANDVSRAADRILEINTIRDKFVASSKREEYLWMEFAYVNRERLFEELYGEEDGARYINYFPQFLIDKCGVTPSTAYTDAKFVIYAHENGWFEILSDDKEFAKYEKKFGKMIRKLRVLCYKNEEIKSMYRKDHNLLGKTVEEIESEGKNPTRAKWTPSRHISKFEIMSTKGEMLKAKIKDTELKVKVENVLKNASRDDWDKFEKMLGI